VKAKKEKTTRRATSFICNDCGLIWELMNPTLIGRNERVYCPKCGDYFEVKVNKVKNKNGQWSDEELSWLDDYINGEMKLYMLMKLTGRDGKCIAKKKYRTLQDLGQTKRKNNAWSDEEKELAIKCMNGEITVAELMELTGRTYGACGRIMWRLKGKQKQKQGEKAND
jgi:transcription elongation factor Elf1